MSLLSNRNHHNISNTSRPPIWADLTLLAGCIAISYFKPLPFPWKVPLIAAIIIGYIYFFYRDLVPIGIKKVNLKSTLLWGTGIALIVVIAISNLLSPLLEFLLDEEVDLTSFEIVKGNFSLLADLWWKAMISAAIAEEIFYRGFCFYVLERLLGTGTWQKIAIVLLTSIYFGLSHAAQGVTGVVGIIAASIVIGGGYYLSKRNLFAVIVGHALIDTWSLYTLYKGDIYIFF